MFSLNKWKKYMLAQWGTPAAAEPQKVGGIKVSVDTTGKSYAVADDVYWRYDTPPKNTHVFLLTEGGVCIVGIHRAGDRNIGWHPLLKRNREVERKLGLSK